MDEKTAKLLWTGGWDSTYRLLNLLIVQNRTVKPYYIIDPIRYSIGAELRARNKIKKMIFDLKPETKKLLLPTEYLELTDIQPREDLTEKYWNLRKKYFMGEQYEWLARFTEQFNLHDLEMSIHIDDKAHYVLSSYVVKVNDNNDIYYMLRDDVENDDYDIFKNFKFPLFNLTKVEMEKNAKKLGFVNIMEETWFCFRPLKDDKPCGICAPCSYAIEEGMKRRIPMKGLMKHKLKKFKAKILGKQKE